MDTTNLSNNLVCVEYPGIVKNVDYMIQTLGGINQISQIFCSDKLRLPLKFRPNNIFAKPAFGDRSTTSGILLKVTTRRNGNKREIKTLSVSIVGVSSHVYQFTHLCDFQYLPIARNNLSNELECIYKNIVPNGLLNPEWLTEHSDDTYFLPPISFSRVESSNNQLFRKELPMDNKEEDDSLIGNRRLRRHKHAKYIQFSLTEPVPSEPHPQANDYLKLKFITNEEYYQVKQLFEKRPIMSKMVVSYETKINSEKLKYILPSICFYYTTGAWRVMWVRYGYDPRRDFESRYYQQMDYRIRMQTGLKKMVDLKRNHTIYKPEKQRSKILLNSEQQKKHNKLYYPYFEPDTFPQSRQCIYQYCDLRIPKIQEMLDKIPTPLSGATCNEKSGWLPVGFDDHCRQIMSEIIKEQLRKPNDDEYDESDSDEYEDMDVEQIEDSDNELDEAHQQ